MSQGIHKSREATVAPSSAAIRGDRTEPAILKAFAAKRLNVSPSGHPAPYHLRTLFSPMQGPFLTPFPSPDSPSRVAGIESAGDSADSKSGDDSIFLRPKHRVRDKNLYGESGHQNGIGYPPYTERGRDAP